MNPAIIFRAEASNQLGLGHMFRCLNFVRSLPFGVRPFFVMRECSEQEKVTRVLKEHDWGVFFLPYDSDAEFDAKETAKIAKKYNAKLLVTDLCHRHIIEEPDNLILYHQWFKKNDPAFILSIEDCRMKAFASHAAVIWNSNEDFKLIGNGIDGCRVLAGTKYFICDPKFSSLGPKVSDIRKKADRILVSIGGSDPKGITSKILTAIGKIADQKINVRLILGDGMSDELLKDIYLISESAGNISTINQTNSMVKLLKWADIAIVGEGLVKYEAAIVGTPSLMISQFDHESKPILEFLKTGCSKRLENPINTRTSGVISDLLMDFETRKKMSLNGLNNFDGRGMERIYLKVLKSLFKGK